jgi:light-regulated signal transduction histidine kinase (bacteriophytochrome)
VLRHKLAEMQAVEDRLLADRTATAARAQLQLVWISALGAVLGLLGGLVAAMTFTSGVASRIDAVGENAARLAQGTPLLRLAPAADEVGRLSGRLEEAGTLLNARVQALAIVNDELEAFSYSVSHDLRAPLRHITGFASLLERHEAAQFDDQGRRYLRTIQDAATAMGRLIDDLLTFSRMGRSVMSTRLVSLNDLVRDAQRETMADINGRDVAWTIHPLPDVHADPAMLRLALVNLLSNALKYTGTRPQARIEIGIDGGDERETVVFVRDNGVGFDMQYAHKLFGVFQRLHGTKEFEGTGIGLANVRRIIHRHGGRTWAEGILDRGATFYLSLPKEHIHADRHSTDSPR